MLIINGVSLPTPFRSVSYIENPAFRMLSDKAPRPGGTWVRGITLHTTQGKDPQPIHPGLGRGGGALANLNYWNGDPDYAGAHLLVDPDGVVYQTADLGSEQTWHATSVNPVTVGVEIVQASDGSLYQGQLDATVQLVNWITEKMGIQRQIPLAYTGRPITRLKSGGRDFVGVFGHRDQTDGRGRGDPGDRIMDMLAAAGYERFNLEANQDKTIWQQRQQALGVRSPDGVPGPATVAALKATKPTGLWVDTTGPSAGKLAAGAIVVAMMVMGAGLLLVHAARG